MKLDSRYIPLLASLGVLVLLYAFGCAAFANRGFTDLSVITNLFRDNAFLGIAAIGATFVILSGGIDLSVGSIVGLVSILVAALCFDPALDPRQVGEIRQLLPAAWLPLHPALAVVIALSVGTAFGLGMGCLVQFFRLPPFLVTLGGMFLARGLAFMIKLESLSIKHPFYTQTIRQDLAVNLTPTAEISFSVFILLALFGAAMYLAHFRRFGRNVYAIGGSEDSASLMGLPVARTKLGVYTLAGFCSALAGVAYTFALSKGDPAQAGLGLELDAIAAVVIGGTLLSGGVGFVAGTLIGVLIFGLIQSLITFQGSLSAWWTRIAVGLLVLAFILLQNFVTKASMRRKKA